MCGDRVLTLLAAAAAFACPATGQSLDEGIADATARYLALDLLGFGAASASVLAEAECLAEPASPATVAGLHRTRALRAWVDRDAPGMIAALSAMRAVEPDVPIDEHLAPPGSRLRDVYDAAGPASEARMAALPGPGWVVDGRADALLVPVDRATFVQKIGPDGAIGRSWYFPMGAAPESLFPDAVPPAPLLGNETRIVTVEHPRRPSRGLAIGSGVALALGAGALAAASVTRAEYLASGPEDGAREGLYTLNLVAGTAGLTGCAAAAGLFAGALLVGRW
jgi:hypothetical protein